MPSRFLKNEIELDDAARDWLANKGCDPAYGARPLRLVIQKALQDTIAEQVLAGEIKSCDGVEVTADTHGFVVNGAAVKQAA